MSTGVITDYDQTLSQSVQPKYKSNTSTKNVMASSEQEISLDSTTDYKEENVSPKCQKMYLRRGNFLKHIDSGTCCKNQKH